MRGLFFYFLMFFILGLIFVFIVKIDFLLTVLVLGGIFYISFFDEIKQFNNKDKNVTYK